MDFQPQYILNLLFEEDCVIVPNVGAFVAQHIGAAFDSRQMRMTPPRKEIIFNAQVRHNDGLLASYVSKECGVSMAEAMKSVDDYAASINRQLKQGSSVMIAGLGSLVMKGGKVNFTPNSSVVLLKTSYGLAPIVVSEHVQVAEIRKSQSRLKQVVGTAVVLAVMLLIPSQVSDNEADRTLVSASVISSFIQDPTQISGVAPEDVEAVEPSTEVKPYHIIVASFARDSQADDYIKKQEMRGVNGLVKLVGKNKVRVSVASFATRAEAAKANRNIRKMPGYESAWILYY
jgi:hypothetical protein